MVIAFGPPTSEMLLPSLPWGKAPDLIFLNFNISARVQFFPKIIVGIDSPVL